MMKKKGKNYIYWFNVVLKYNWYSFLKRITKRNAFLITKKIWRNVKRISHIVFYEAVHGRINNIIPVL